MTPAKAVNPHNPAVSCDLDNAIIITKHPYNPDVLEPKFLKARHALTEREAFKRVLSRIIVIIDHHLFRMHSIDVKEDLTSGFHRCT